MKNPNGFGSITKLSGRRRKPYRVRKTAGWDIVDGKPKQRYINIGCYETKADALAALYEYNRSPYDTTARKLSVNGVFELWFEKHKDKVCPERAAIIRLTWKHYRTVWDRRFTDMKAIDWEHIIGDPGMNRTAAINGKHIIGMMYNYAIKHDICTVNYAERIDVKIDTSVKIVRHPFTMREIEAISDGEIKDLVLIGCYTGMRINELITLTKEHVHEEDGIMYIKHGSKTEAGRNRIIPVHPDIEALVKKKIAQENFFAYKGKKLSLQTAKSNFSSKLKKTTHDMRHTFATNWFGLNPVYGKLIMGHAVKDITIDVYTHISVKDLYAEMKKYKIK